MSTFILFVLLRLLDGGRAGAQYVAQWESLDARPLPTWYDEAKFGIFVHWGVYSVPSYKDVWYWWWLDDAVDPDYVHFHERQYGKGFKYADFAPQFKAGLFKPEDWANLFKDAGAKYVVLTSKHHDGFTLWPSASNWNWNSMDVGPHRDLVGDLTNAVKGANLKMGLYHSLYEWFNPMYMQDKKNGFKTRDFPTRKTIPELHDLVKRYEPSLVWSDGDWEADETYWASKEFLAWLFSDSPVKDTVVVNDRWCMNCSMRHGSYYSGKDRQQPGPQMMGHKWENAFTIDSGSWSYSRVSELANYQTSAQLTWQLVATVAYGGNFLLNVGPTADGIILPIFEERLRDLGKFLDINGEAVYATKTWDFQNETISDLAVTVFYTHKEDAVYAFFLPVPRLPAKIHLTKVQWTKKAEVAVLSPDNTQLSRYAHAESDGSLTVDVDLPELPGLHREGMVFKLTNVLPFGKEPAEDEKDGRNEKVI